ncbi:MAG TPA: FtsX-like permease family protein [Gammaproteobacteria bacterium]|nr:FtsX-like permease family protein [Gammaproteobacteria bacterium]
MLLGLSLKLFWRELKSGQLSIMFFALVLAVGTVSSISLFTDRLEKALLAETQEFLGGDLKFESNDLIEDKTYEEIQNLNLKSTEIVLFASMLASGDSLQLASIKAVDQHYPLVGGVELRSKSEKHYVKRPPGQGQVWLDVRLMDILKIKIGETVSIGDADFIVSYSILSEPDRASNSFAFAPKAIINTLDLEKTKQPGDNIREAKDSNDSLGKAIERSGNFFLLGGLLAVLMAAFTVGMSSQRFARRHVEYVAILKSLGTESWEIKLLYSLIFIELGVFAIFLGLILGWFMQEAFTGILKQYFPTDLPTPGFKPLLISSLTVFICLIGFVYPNLVKLVKISPLNILRREESKASNSSYLMFALALSAMFLLVFLYTQRLLLSSIVFFTILFIFVLGYGLILSFFRSKTRLGLGAHNSLSLAWSELHRRKYTNSLQVLAFSMAIGLSLIAFSARTDLMSTWESTLPADSPNNFLINISKSDLNSISSFLEEKNIEESTFYPITNTVIIKLPKGGEEVSKPIDRNFNATWSSELPQGNKVISGEWFKGDSSDGLSVSNDIATRYSLEIGDPVKVFFADQEIDTYIQNIREVNWDNFSPNFFLIGPPEIFKNSPATYITSLYVPKEKDKVISEFMSEFKTVSVLSIDAIINQVNDIIEQVSKALEVILGLTIFSAMFLTLATIQDGFNLRLHQSAILRTFGASTSLLQKSTALEFALLGLLAGLLGALLAQIGIFFLETQIFDLEATFHANIWIMGPIIGTVLICALSIILILSITRKNPKEIIYSS